MQPGSVGLMQHYGVLLYKLAILTVDFNAICHRVVGDHNCLLYSVEDLQCHVEWYSFIYPSS